MSAMDGHVKEPYEMSMALGARPYSLVLSRFCLLMTPGGLVENMSSVSPCVS